MSYNYPGIPTSNPNKNKKRKNVEYEKMKTKGQDMKELLIAVLAILAILPTQVAAKKMDHTKAVIHHTASHDVSAEEIDRWHKQNTYVDKYGKVRHWDGIGYHYVIRKDGSIEAGRDPNKLGAHAKGRNHYLGIVLTGYDTFTPEQINALKTLLVGLKIKHIEGHHEDCPGPGINLNQIRSLIQ